MKDLLTVRVEAECVGVGKFRIREAGVEAGGGRTGGAGAVEKSRSVTNRRNRCRISRSRSGWCIVI